MSSLNQNAGFVHSHAYIIAAPDAEQRQSKALELACYFLCGERDGRPCLRCVSCKNVLNGFHPDLIDIVRKSDDKGKQKREIQVEQIRRMAADAYVRPTQAEKKVYLIRDADAMNIQAQNAALKILEEPPEYAVFILCVESVEALLPTVRSRCALIRLAGTKAGEESAFAQEYLRLAAQKDEAKLCTFFGKRENMDAEQLSAFVGALRFGLNEFMRMEKTYPGLTREDAFRFLSLCDRADAYLRLNVGAKHILGLLCVLTI